MIMKPYDQKPKSKICRCIQCGPDRKPKGGKSAARFKAKKEIKNEASETFEKHSSLRDSGLAQI